MKTFVIQTLALTFIDGWLVKKMQNSKPIIHMLRTLINLFNQIIFATEKTKAGCEVGKPEE